MPAPSACIARLASAPTASYRELQLTQVEDVRRHPRSAIVEAERAPADGPHPFRMMSVGSGCATVVAVIEPLADTPAGVVGFRVAGEIHREDYDNVLTPALKQALESGNGVRALYLIESLDKMDPGALWADVKVGFDLGIRHHDGWVRSGIVTDIDWLAQTARAFAWMIPGEVRVFPVASIDEAQAWVAGT
jgi:SpoIIAA-like